MYQKKFDQFRAEALANLIHAPFGLARFDLAMNYIFVTDRWRKDYQVHEVNLIGKCHYDVYPEIPDHWKVIHKRGLSGEVIKGTEEAFPRNDGRVDYVNWVVMPWRDLNKNICGIDILSEVVTARVEAKHEVDRLKAQLEELVIERTKKLEQLLEHEKHLNHLKSELMAIASHELRTPAGIILSTCHLLAQYVKSGQSDKLKILLGILQDSVTDMTRTINRLLNFESIRLGSILVQPESVDIRLLLEGVCYEIRPKLKSKQKIEIDQEALPIFLSDSNLLRQIIKNLILNAIKYSPARALIKIVVRYQRGCLKLSVIDQGIGIEKEDIRMLSRQYYRAKNALRYPGMGMGLYVAYRFAQLIDGKITCRSTPGLGSCFTFTLKQLKIEKDPGN